MRRTIAMLWGLALVGIAPACSIQTGDADKYRAAFPQGTDPLLALAGSQVSGTATQSASAGAVRLQGTGSGGTTTPTGLASYYEFTRTISDAVDTVTVLILGEVVVVASLPPTTIDSNHAVWGPGSSDALDPVSWKLVVTETAPDQFTYEVDGRPHLSTSDADWQAILTGTGYGPSNPGYRSGNFTVNNDALRGLDPTRTSSTGSVVITYDSRTWPTSVEASVTTDDGSGQSYDVTVDHGQDGSGVMTLVATADVSTPPDGVNENVAENSRWDSTGAGRADIKLTGGDFGSTNVMASQCWSDAFTQTYYTDSAGYEPTAGQASSCAFAQASFLQ